MRAATKTPMFCCASSVEPPMCGVRITLRIPCSGEVNCSLLLRGSSGKTSTAAPRTFPFRRFLASASMSTT